MRFIRLLGGVALTLALVAGAAEAHTRTFNSQNVYVSATDTAETGFWAVTGRIVGNPQCIANRKVKMVVYYPDGAGGFRKEVADVGHSGKNGFWATGADLGPGAVAADFVATRKRLPTQGGHRHFCARSKFVLS